MSYNVGSAATNPGRFGQEQRSFRNIFNFIGGIMVLISVSKPKRRLIYIDGVYDADWGLSPGPFDLEPGPHLIETVNGQSEIDYRTEVAGSSDEEVDLNRVEPPEPL
jgi:hypothetical protein